MRKLLPFVGLVLIMAFCVYGYYAVENHVNTELREQVESQEVMISDYKAQTTEMRFEVSKLQTANQDQRIQIGTLKLKLKPTESETDAPEPASAEAPSEEK